MIFGQGLKKYSYKFGKASAGTLQKIRQAEKKINYYDKFYTGGVAGDIYRASPAYQIIQPIRQTSKALLHIGEEVGMGIGEGKLKKVFSGLGKAGEMLDYGSQTPYYKNFVSNPIVNRIYNSPFIQSNLN